MLNGLYYFDVNTKKLYGANREQVLGTDLDSLYVVNKIEYVKQVSHLKVFKITPNILTESELQQIQLKKFHTTIYCKTDSDGIIIDIQHVDVNEDGIIRATNLKSLGYVMHQGKR